MEVPSKSVETHNKVVVVPIKSGEALYKAMEAHYKAMEAHYKAVEAHYKAVEAHYKANPEKEERILDRYTRYLMESDKLGEYQPPIRSH